MPPPKDNPRSKRKPLELTVSYETARLDKELRQQLIDTAFRRIHRDYLELVAEGRIAPVDETQET